MTPTATIDHNTRTPGDAPAGSSGPRRVAAIVRRRLAPFDARLDPYSWLAAGLVTLVAAILRLVNLAHPKGKLFDELYYATEAQAMLRYGVEWDLENNTPKYVVHPPLGKWSIALGEWLFGYNEFGWRISAAVAGIGSVLIVTRVARRMFGSTVLGCAAGLLVALDGMHLVLSRSALLDIFLMFFLTASFACLVLDRDARRRRWLSAMEGGLDPSRPGPAGRPRWSWRDGSWRRGVPWWRLASGVLFGLAFGVKWSAVFYLPVFVLLVLLWEAGARRSAGVRRPWRDTILDESGWLALTGVLAGLAYLATWTGWFLTDVGHKRHFLQQQGQEELPIIGALYNLYAYHREALGFHGTLSSTHPYQSEPWQWLVLGRPVLFYFTGDGPCGSDACASTVLLLGTPLLWWSFIIALPLALWFGIARRDWRATPILLGAAAGIVPWFWWAIKNRTMFYFYAIPSEPFLILAVVFVLGMLMTSPPGMRGTAEAADRRMVGAIVAGGYMLLIGLCFAYFYPMYVGKPIPYAEWSVRLWLGRLWQ